MTRLIVSHGHTNTPFPSDTHIRSKRCLQNLGPIYIEGVACSFSEAESAGRGGGRKRKRGNIVLGGGAYTVRVDVRYH